MRAPSHRAKSSELRGGPSALNRTGQLASLSWGPDTLGLVPQLALRVAPALGQFHQGQPGVALQQGQVVLLQFAQRLQLGPADGYQPDGVHQRTSAASSIMTG